MSIANWSVTFILDIRVSFQKSIVHGTFGWDIFAKCCSLGISQSGINMSLDPLYLSLRHWPYYPANTVTSCRYSLSSLGWNLLSAITFQYNVLYFKSFFWKTLKILDFHFNEEQKTKVLSFNCFPTVAHSTGGLSELFEALWCHVWHVIPYIFCISYRLLSAWCNWSVEMVHKTQNLAPFDPKYWYNVRKMSKGKLLFVFSVVVFCIFVTCSVSWNWHPRLIHNKTIKPRSQNTVSKFMWSHVGSAWHYDAQRNKTLALHTNTKKTGKWNPHL